MSVRIINNEEINKLAGTLLNISSNPYLSSERFILLSYLNKSELQKLNIFDIRRIIADIYKLNVETSNARYNENESTELPTISPDRDIDIVESIELLEGILYNCDFKNPLYIVLERLIGKLAKTKMQELIEELEMRA